MSPRQNIPNSANCAPPPIAPGSASAICGLSPQHLARMADRGQLTALKPGGTHRRYVRSEIEALVEPAVIDPTRERQK